ncbi:MAG: hypothetical protein A2Z14_15805 [Chloroflexi bacterium RBG_16_48_8]|nr:MAG: hypothetical protein A2Z14_15805 [Chloroflexi bacterium RBG_16_48_8]
MALTPRITLEDENIQGMKCAICGNPDLIVIHVEKYPDFASCNRCGAAFVVENEGSWVMYGKIPAEYPQTSQFALRQWTWLDAVAQRAADERETGSAPSFMPQEPVEQIKQTPTHAKESTPTFIEQISTIQENEAPESAPTEVEVLGNKFTEDLMYSPPFTGETKTLIEEGLKPLAQDERYGSLSGELPGLEETLAPSLLEPIDLFETKEEDQPELLEEEKLFPKIKLPEDETIGETAPQLPDADFLFPEEEPIQQEIVQPIFEQEKPAEVEERSKGKPSTVPVGEPEPDKRFRVTIQGSPPKYPKNYCAHCLRTPVKTKAIMRGSLPDPNRPGKRKLVPLELPFCKDCQKRMNAQSDDEKNARLLAFLLSGLIALIAIVATLALGVINLSENLLVGLIILLVVAMLGFSIPIMISLTWASRHPPPRDAAFVLSTLLVSESGEDRTEFEWRNHGYAELFRQVNQENAMGGVVPIQDRITFSEIETEKTESSQKQKPKSKPPKKPIQGEDSGT